MGFKQYFPIGKPNFSIELYQGDVDEIILLDISKNKLDSKKDYSQLKLFIKKCFIPITFGGGITCLDDVHNIINSGADRVSMNTNAYLNPNLIKQTSEAYGQQCVVVSIDYKDLGDNKKIVYIEGGTKYGKKLMDWAKECEDMGAGEILLNSIDRDGKGNGYDVQTIKEVSNNLKIPVIACGGVGKFTDFEKGIKQGGASAVAAANIFHFVEHSTIIAKANMLKKNIQGRLNKIAQKKDRKFDKYGRLIMLDDDQLEEADWTFREN